MTNYQAPMLPDVDYQKIDGNFAFSLTHLEHGIMRDYFDFLEQLKIALMEEHLIQVPELLVAHLCAYLGTAITVHTVKQAEHLEPFVIDLIKHQANSAYQHFNQYPVNSTVENDEEKRRNAEILRQTAPSSIVAQTMHLGREIMDALEELADHREEHFDCAHPPKQTELFCSQEKLIKVMLIMSSKKCAEWRKELNGLSDHYILNQLSIQIGWLIGYFSHLDNQPPEETTYFDYGIPIITLYREYVYKSMETYATAVHERAAEDEKLKSDKLISEIHSLSEKVQSERPPLFTDFQKQTAIVQADMEKKLIEMLSEGYSIKITLMSLFYFWFTLESPLHTDDFESIDNHDAFSHMGAIIELVKKLIRSLPAPDLTENLKELNEKMQLMKSNLPSPEELDNPPENIEQQTAHVNATIHAATSEYLIKQIPIDAITNVLFSHWLRLSVFFGVAESDWQKMDYYFPDIMKAVREYLDSVYSMGK